MRVLYTFKGLYDSHDSDNFMNLKTKDINSLSNQFSVLHICKDRYQLRTLLLPEWSRDIRENRCLDVRK